MHHHPHWIHTRTTNTASLALSGNMVKAQWFTSSVALWAWVVGQQLKSCLCEEVAADMQVRRPGPEIESAGRLTAKPKALQLHGIDDMV